MKKKYDNNLNFLKFVFRALCSQPIFGGEKCWKVFSLLKNGQKKCPKTKTQNTFQLFSAPPPESDAFAIFFT